MATHTLAEVRTRVRTWLEDAGASPLWSDAELDVGLRRALDAYSELEPAQQSATITAAAGDTALTLPTGVRDLYRLIDPNGSVLPQRAASPTRYTSDEEQSWELWDADILLARPATAGDYTIRYLTWHVFPAADADDFPVPDVDLSLIVANACAGALELRAREEWKRGPLPARYEGRIDAARRDYQDLLAARRRRVRTATVEVSG